MTFRVLFVDGQVWVVDVPDTAVLNLVQQAFDEEPKVVAIEILKYSPA